ncbi:MAG: 50S ribosomal protein L11 methyltransferase [Desulfosarcinaceae bacterium]
MNFRQCVAVSPKITLCPDQTSITNHRRGVMIRLAGGDAFGLGDHPTTRLALRGIEFAVDMLSEKGAGAKALDIGTGSGVLALAAAMLGIGQVHAVDNDPVARHEAGENIKNNVMAGRVLVDSRVLEEMPAREFCLIMANLRPPTLRGIFGRMSRLSKPTALWVLSGFRPAEGCRLSEMLEKRGASILWRQDEKNWSAFLAELNIQALEGIEHSPQKAIS